MKIIVLNGSPKSKDFSVTMQYIAFIQNNYPSHQFEIIDIGSQIQLIDKEAPVFNSIIEKVKSSDGLLWAFPLYFCLVSSQYKRFIELIFERNAEDSFKGKYTASFSTSIHFFDHTAHNYINAISDDLDMVYTGFFSAEMHDFLDQEKRKKLLYFAEKFLDAISKKKQYPKNYPKITLTPSQFKSHEVLSKLSAGDKKIVLLADKNEPQSNLSEMIKQFQKTFKENIEIYYLKDLNIKGGCQGCIQCGLENRCVYEGKDDYIDFFNHKLKTADIIVFAGTIKDRYLSSTWKLFFDRSFFNTHSQVFLKKQIGFLISGPFSQIPNLKQIFQGFFDLQGANLTGFISDENQDSEQIASLISQLAEDLINDSESEYIKPSTFLGIGGLKIFRDDIWGRLRFVFLKDHQFYKEHGIYDFPQKYWKTRFLNTVMILLLKIPGFKKEFQKRIKTEMVKPYKKILLNQSD